MDTRKTREQYIFRDKYTCHGKDRWTDCPCVVVCPFCGALAGCSCVTRVGNEAGDFHWDRKKDAVRQREEIERKHL